MGGGLELALACHIRVAGSGTVFAVPEAPAGAMPGWGNTQRLVRYFGRPKAFELALTGNQITSAEARALGAVNHVVAGADVLAKAREITEAIARLRTKSVEAIMAAMHVPAFMPAFGTTCRVSEVQFAPSATVPAFPQYGYHAARVNAPA